jgi:hypothetical protein
MNLKLVILDANVIIELFRRSLFNSILSRYQINIPEIIKEECIYYLNDDGKRIDLNLDQYVTEGKLKVIFADGASYLKLTRELNDDFYRGIDDGEKEALAIIHASNDETLLFCSGDLPAIKALGVIGKSSQAISLETLLDDIGAKNLKLRAHFTKQLVDKEAGKAFQERDMYLKRK